MNPLPLLLESYERFGPVFTLRLFHGNVVFMLGPAANHYITVSHASNFLWRDLAFPRPDRPDGRRAAHDRRRFSPPLALDHAPGFPPRAHRRLGGRDGRRDRPRARELARASASTSTRGRVASPCGSRCERCSASTPTASRALDRRRRPVRAGPLLLRLATTPCACFADLFTPWARMQQAAARSTKLIYSEISRRRATGERGEDILSPAARRPGRRRRHADRPADPRRGDDADVRRPRHDHLDRLVHVLRARPPARRSSRACSPSRMPALADGAPNHRATHVRRAARARDGARRDPAQVPARVDRPAPLDRAVRVRRPHRPRRARSSTTAPGPRTTCPTSSQSPRSSAPSASRRRPSAALPKGAYVPFGGGSRTCIGMRFGQLEVRTIATLSCSPLHALAPRGLRAHHPPDADDQPQGRPADDRCTQGTRTSISHLAAVA